MEVSLESKALTLLETYEGANNYILELKRKSQINSHMNEKGMQIILDRICKVSA
jgi:hypothetical protein